MKRDIEGQPKAVPTKPPIQLLQKKLSEFPLEQIPASLAVGNAVAATAGFEQTKGLASLLALMVLMGTSVQMMHAQNCTARNLMKNLAWTINFFGLRDCVSWAFSASGDISSATSSLADFSPGYLIKHAIPSAEILSSHQETARALDIPADICMCIMSDSTLTLHRSPLGR